MIDYSQFPGLDGVYLEDSYVLSIEETPAVLSFKLFAVLTPDHPAYRDPLPGDQYCYAKGDLVVGNASKIEWLRRSNSRFVDAAGEEDLGNIDVLAKNGEELLVEGDWGEVRVENADSPRFEID